MTYKLVCKNAWKMACRAVKTAGCFKRDTMSFCYNIVHAIMLLMAAERALQSLRPVRKSSGSQCLHALQSEGVLRPFLSACATKEPELTIRSLKTIQKLFTLDCVTSTTFATIIGTLRVQAESQDEQVLLKILQTLLLASTPRSFQVDEETFRQAFMICFRLHEIGNPAIHNTASAALLQFTSLLFYHASGRHANAANELDPVKSPTSQNSEPPILQKSALLFIHDMYLMAHMDTSQWLKLNKSSPLTVCLEVIDAVLKTPDNIELFCNEKDFRVLLQEHICPLLAALIRSDSKFPITLRVLRCIQTITFHYHSVLVTECEVFMSTLIRVLEPEYELWRKILSLETLKSLCAVPRLLYFFFTHYDMDRDTTIIFGSMAHALGRFVHLRALDGADFSAGSKEDSALWGFFRSASKGLDLLAENDPPNYDEMYSVSLSIGALIHIVHALSELEKLRARNEHVNSPIISDEYGQIPLGIPGQANGTDELNIDEEALKGMVNVSWRPILTALSMLLEQCNTDERTQHLLLAYQSFTTTCGSLRFQEPRDQFIRSLCAFALPPGVRARSISDPTDVTEEEAAPRALSIKNIQSLKALFNIAHCLGDSLGGTWMSLLETFEALDRLFLANEALFRSQQIKGIKGDQIQITQQQFDDIRLLKEAMARLFESSSKLTLPAVHSVLAALGTLSLCSLANAASTENNAGTPDLPTRAASTKTNAAASPGGKFEPRLRMFALVNLITTIEHNMYRIDSLWDVAVSHLNCIVNHKLPPIRRYGVDSLTKLCVLAITSTSGANGTRKIEGGRSVEEFQHALLAPLLDLHRSKWEDAREQILCGVLEILESCGQALRGGWPVLLELLQEVVKLDPLPPYVYYGFKSIQLITNDFLDCVPCNCIQTLIETIGLYGIQKFDPNTSFTSIGLLWHVSDYLSSLAKKIPNQQSSSDSTNPENGVANGVSGSEMTKDLCDQLQISVFRQLELLSLDPRPEVRNSAVQTVHAAVVAYGPRMHARSWLECTRGVLEPLMLRVFEDTELGSSKGDMELGTEKSTGKKVMMMVHHSRNTAEKQWDETRVHILQGAARVFRMFFISLCDLDYFEEFWNKFLRVVELSILVYSCEVASGGIAALQEVLVGQETIKVLSTKKHLWSPVMDLYKTVVDESLQFSSTADYPFDTYTVLLDSLLELTRTGARSRALFSDGDLGALIAKCNDLARVQPISRGESKRSSGIVVSNKRETPLQKKVLKVFEAIMPMADDLMIETVNNLVGYIRRVGEAISPKHVRSTSCRRSFIKPVSQRCEESKTVFAKKSVDVLYTIFVQKVTNTVRARTFEGVIGALSSVMTWRGLPGDLTKAAVQTFCKAISVGLPALNQVGCSEGEALRIWSLLADTLSEFLHPYQDYISHSTAPRLETPTEKSSGYGNPP
eukprot:91619_1